MSMLDYLCVGPLGGLPAPPTPEVLHWPFDDGSGSTVTALVGPNGTFTGAGWGAGPGSLPAAVLDGSTSYVLAASNVAYGSPICTVSLWALTSASDRFMFFSNRNSVSANETFQYSYAGGTRINGFFKQAAGQWVEPEWPLPTLGVWNHHLVTFDHAAGAGTAISYLNGTLQSYYSYSESGTFSSTADWSSGPFTLGRSMDIGSFFWSGSIAALRIYDRYLSTAEIATLVAEGS
jgi:hypothetical protein